MPYDVYQFTSSRSNPLNFSFTDITWRVQWQKKESALKKKRKKKHTKIQTRLICVWTETATKPVMMLMFMTAQLFWMPLWRKRFKHDLFYKNSQIFFFLFLMHIDVTEQTQETARKQHMSRTGTLSERIFDTKNDLAKQV